MINKKPIPHRVYNPSSDHPYVAGAVDIIDDVKGKNQEQVNTETDNSLEMLRDEIDARIDQNYYTVEATDADTSIESIMSRAGVVPAKNTVYRVGFWDGTEYDESKYSEYAWNESGNTWKLLDVKEYTLATADDFIEPDAEKRAKIPTVGAVADVYGQYEESPEWVDVKTDSEDKVLEGIKADGTKYVGGDLEVGGTIHNADLDAKFAQKVDKEEGKSLINKDYADDVSYIENLEFVNVKLDANDKIIEGVREDGTKVIGGDFEVGGDAKILGKVDIHGATCALQKNPEFIQITTDSEGKVLQSRNAEGINKEYVGTETPTINGRDVNELIKVIDGLKDDTLVGQKYSKIFKQEANDALKRFIPISSTVLVDDLEQVNDRNFVENLNLLLMTDSHIDYTAAEESMQNVKDVVDFANSSKRVMQQQNMRINKSLFDAVINTGDTLTRSNPDKSIALRYAQTFFEETKKLNIPFLFTQGNHDRNDSNQIPSVVITDEDWMNLYGDYAETHYGIVRQTKSNGKKSQWWYKDIEDKKVRIIGVYVNDVDYSVTNNNGKVLYNESNGFYIAQEQMSWLVNTALNFDNKADSDWGVIVCSHQTIHLNASGQPWYATGAAVPAADKFESAIEKFFEVCKAFNSQGTYSNNYTFAAHPFFNLSINADFTRYASTDKWNETEWNQTSGTNKGEHISVFRKTGDNLTFNMVNADNHITSYIIYAKYVGGTGLERVDSYVPNQENTIVPDQDIEEIYVLVNSTDITGDVSATFRVLQEKPHIICWLNGHEHVDLNMVKDGINIIWTAQQTAMTAFSDRRVARLIGTSTQNLFDLISIDTFHRKIKIVRVGAGKNCFGAGGDRFLPNGLDY